MTTLLQQIEEMRVQVNELTGGEQKLLHVLSDALTRADHQLLHDVRNVAAEHERRRRMNPQGTAGTRLVHWFFPG